MLMKTNMMSDCFVNYANLIHYKREAHLTAESLVVVVNITFFLVLNIFHIFISF